MTSLNDVHKKKKKQTINGKNPRDGANSLTCFVYVFYRERLTELGKLFFQK